MGDSPILEVEVYRLSLCARASAQYSVSLRDQEGLQDCARTPVCSSYVSILA